MKIQLSDGNIASVYFRYHEVEVLDSKTDEYIKVKQSTAVVEFLLNDGRENPNKEKLSGFTLCSIRDNFSRIMGRKIALSRALSKLSKEDTYIRREIWEGLAEHGMKMEHKKHEREVYVLSLEEMLPPMFSLNVGNKN